MATLKNLTVSSTGADTLPRGTTTQRPGTPLTGMMRYNTSFNETEYYNGTSWINPTTGAIAGLGQTAATAAGSAIEIQKANPAAADGVYWINLPTVGAQQIYCLMDKRYDGGGWMMALKATRGTTFVYSSSYWTTTNVLNETTQLNRNDADAKFHTFNYFQSKDLLAIWPDIGEGGSIRGLSNWIWLENNFYSDRIALPTFFSSNTRWFIGDAKLSDKWQNGVFSSQTDIRFYGFNWNDNLPSRWGFGWNENGGGLFPNGNEGSDDVMGGIGHSGASAGDQINCCADTTGINRSARVEMYVR